MSTPQYSTSELISNVKIRCAVPTEQLAYTDADFCSLANDELQGEVVPLIMSTREEYFVESLDFTTDSTGIIEIPSDAVGAKLRSVCFVNSTTPEVITNVPRIDLDVVAGVGFFNRSVQAGFYVQGNSLHLYPATSVPTGTNMRLYYYRRTLVLTDDTNFGQVLSIDTMSNSMVLSSLPTDWEAGTEVNSVSELPNFATTNSLMTIASVSDPSIIVDDVTGVQVGDYISRYGFAAIPQVPVEAHPYLAQLTAVKLLEGLGDRAGMKAAQAKADILKKNLLIMVSQRVDGAVKKIVHPSGGLRFSGFRRRGWGW